MNNFLICNKTFLKFKWCLLCAPWGACQLKMKPEFIRWSAFDHILKSKIKWNAKCKIHPRCQCRASVERLFHSLIAALIRLKSTSRWELYVSSTFILNYWNLLLIMATLCRTRIVIVIKWSQRWAASLKYFGQGRQISVPLKYQYLATPALH